MNVGTGDVEVYPNFFCVSFVDYHSDEIVKFEISERKNQLEEIVKFLITLPWFIGFNNIHYDNLILMYLVKNFKRLKSLNYLEITAELKTLNDLIINDDNGYNYKKYSAFKYNQPWQSIDIFLYWSKMLRISKKLSLKSLSVNINWHRIQELPLPPDHIIQLDEIDDVMEYNINDSLVTKAVAKKQSESINLRVDAKKRYELDCMSWDGVKLGLYILVKRYCARTGLDIDTVKKMRTVRSNVPLKDLLLPIIHFKDNSLDYIQFVEKKSLVTQFKSFKGLFEYLKGMDVSSTSQINCRILYKGVRYDIKSGGLHTYHNPGIVVPAEDEYYEDKDVSSYYPTLGAEWEMIPEHLGKEFAEELNSIRHERLKLKAEGKGKGNEAELLKLSMNGGFYGNTNNEYTPMQDMRCMLNITINGQLLLLMLCEWLIDIGVEIDMCNTDGITIKYKKYLRGQVEELCNKWQKLTRMELETVKYLKVVRMNINNYMAIYEKKPGVVDVKQKGMFLTDPPIDQSRDFLVIAHALYANYTVGTSVEQFIRNHTDIYDFCASKKMDRKYSVWWNGKKQQRLNRYFVTKGGAYLYKSKDGINMENVLSGSTVQIFNNYEKKEMKDYNIHYDWYISEAKKIINELEPRQSTLF